MKIKITSLFILTALMINLVLGGIGVYAAAPLVYLSGADCNAGEEVAVTVNLSDNPGIVSMILDIKYDSSYFTIKKIEDAGIFGDSLHSDDYDLNPYRLCWANDLATENFMINGKIATIYFTASPETPAGSYPFNVSYNLNDYEIFNKDLQPVEFGTKNTTVNVIKGGSGIATPAPATPAPATPKPSTPVTPVMTPTPVKPTPTPAPTPIPEPTSGIAVTFTKHTGATLFKKFITDTHSVTAPEGAFVYGYGFTNWVTNTPGCVPSVNAGDVLTEGEVGTSTTYKPQYGLSNRVYTITVDGGTLENGNTEGEFKYNEKVTVTHGEAKENFVFAYWSKNGQAVSYDDTYSFYAGETVTVKAVFLHISEAFNPEPVVSIEKPVMITYKDMIGFAVEKHVPSGYTPIEFGIIMSDEFNERIPFNLKFCAKIVAKSAKNDASGQFTARKADVSSGDIWYARGYLTYKDNETGETKTVYSPVVGAKMP